MGRRLPPLNSLKCFEAAGRLLSFTNAANELNVTQAAISHQIKALEEQLGVSLFRRLTRALRLTEAGQAALPPLRDGFDKLADAVDLLRAHEESGAITVSLDPSFAAKWLVPRLDRFRGAQHGPRALRPRHAVVVVDLHRTERHAHRLERRAHRIAVEARLIRRQHMQRHDELAAAQLGVGGGLTLVVRFDDKHSRFATAERVFRDKRAAQETMAEKIPRDVALRVRGQPLVGQAIHRLWKPYVAVQMAGDTIRISLIKRGSKTQSKHLGTGKAFPIQRSKNS